MFTGIIEMSGRVTQKIKDNTNLSFWVSSAMSNDLQRNQSVAHNGVCLTIENVRNGEHQVTVVKESLSKTNFQNIQEGDQLNLERCLRIGDRLDGHFVQGHVDTTAQVIEIKNEQGSHVLTFQLPAEQTTTLLVEKGSVTINGISLTCFQITKNQFSVAIIPHTFSLTTMQYIKPKDIVNIEFDILGKYILQQRNLSS